MNSLPDSSRIVAEEIGRLLGCRWSFGLLMSIRGGVDRPGALLRANVGMTEKVMRFCLARMIQDGVLHKRVMPGRVKGVSYQITPYGIRIIAILDQIVDAAHHAPVQQPGADGTCSPPAADP